MSQAIIELLTIATATTVVIAVALHIRKINKALKEARRFNLRLQVQLAVHKDAEYALQSEVNNLERGMHTLVAFAAELLQDIEVRKAQAADKPHR